MMSICGMDCCGVCSRKEACGGCAETDGCPFGGRCVAAECIKRSGFDAFLDLKRTMAEEFRSLGIENLQAEDLHLLNGFLINLEYRLPNGRTVKLLKDEDVYLGSRIELPTGGRCCGLAADERYLLICEYGCDGTDAEIVAYKRR